MGSVASAITPTSVMTMLITPAKIGRSMKKWGKFMARLTSDDELVSLRSASLSGGGRLLRNRLHGHTSLQQLHARADNFLAILQPVFHNPFSFEKTPSLQVTAFDSIIGLDDECVFQSLLRADHSVRDECSPIRRCARDAHANKETRRNEVRVPVFYNDSRTHRPRARIKTVINEFDCA